jgi:1-acyl-sn-glycerol-3-phosphate acyltransferase
VRANFFYQQWAGMFVNLFIGGGRMFPPFFREASKQDFNKWALLRVVDELKRGEILVGYFPEGTRNKNADPYEPLPAQPGVGKLIMDTWPIVVPAFINGLTNNIIGDLYGNYRHTKRVVAVFGEPMDLSPFKKMGNRLTSQKRVADAVLKRIYELGEEERVIRAKLD